jgi:hypothetical protein
MIRIILLSLIVLGTPVLTACPTKQCTPKMARCQNNCVQLCRPDGKWQNVVDCAKADKVPWTCNCTGPQTCRCKKPEVPAPASRP